MPVTHKSSVWNDSHSITGVLGTLDLLSNTTGYLKNDGLGNLTWAIVAGGTTPALFTSSTSGIVPASGGGTVNYLRADGTWAASSASVAWGGITGTLSTQTDLNTALGGKQPLATNLTSIGGLANAAGWLHNDGAGAFVYSTPAAASWPVSGTPAIISTLGALANATGHLFNNGSGTLSWVAEYTLPTATSSVLGGVKPDGTSILNTAGAISATVASVGAQAALSGTGFVKISGTTISYDNSAYYLASNPSGYTANLGTVTSVAAITLGTTGTDLSSTVATGTTTPVITLQVPTASGTNRGALSSGDWTTFNGKQAAFTILGTLGALANASGVLTNNGSGTLSWAAGGGMTNPMTTLGDLIYENAVPAAARLAGPTVNGTYVLTEIPVAGASVAPVWTLANTIIAGDITGGATNNLLYQTAANATGYVTSGNYGSLVSSSTGAPSWTTPAAGVLYQASTTTVPAFTTTPTLTGTNFSGIPGGAINSAVANATLAATATAIAAGTANQIPYQTGAGVTSFFSASNYGVHVYGSTGVPQSIAGAAGVLQGSAAAIPAFTTTPTLTGTNFTGVPTSGLTGALAAAQFPALTGDVTTVAGALATTLVTTQPSVHTWTLVQTFSATDVHTLGATFTASASVSTAGYVGYNSTQLAHEFFADGLKHQLTGTIFTQTATGTNGAATAITDIMGTGVGTRVLPTSWTLTGKTIRVRCAGTVTTAATPGTTVITLRLNAGTPVTIVASPSLTLTASMTSMPFEIEFLLTCRSTTSIMGTGKFLVSSSTTGITGLSVLIGTVTAATVVAATSYTVQICATDGTASGTVYTTQTASVEVLN